jgi:tetratricopeptide (TPR) repeat protein
MSDGHAGESTIERIDAIRDRFEKSWLSGERPRLEEFVAQVRPDDRALLLVDLLQLELSYRRDAGETPDLADYLGRFPGHEQLVAGQLNQPARTWSTAGPAPTTRGPVEAPPTGVPPPQAREGTEQAPGPRAAGVPGYEILGLLGRGGMGIVWKARHLSLNRVVALKMILGGAHGEERGRSRFRAEAEVVARLRHPNIVQIYEVGEVTDESGAVHPFMALELVDGGNLARQIDGTPQLARPTAELIEVLAQAVQAAHDAGVVHRDLKPANVLLARNPASGGVDPRRDEPGGSSPLAGFVPKLADFGLAKRLDAADHTQSGLIMGTPGYMAPEQAAGQNKEVGPPADVWALGAILYELLTGRAPFRGASVAETLAQIVTEEPVPPHRLNRAAPRDLETICLKCLQKEPRKRYPSAAALAEDLRRVLDGRPIEARPVSALERGLKWARRRPAQAALVGAVLLAVLCGSVGALFYGLYKDQQAAASERDREQLRKQLARRQKIDAECNEGQRQEDAGEYDQAKEHWDRALALLDAEPEPSLEDFRGRIEEHRRRVQQRLNEKTAQQESVKARQQWQDKQRRFRKHADEVLIREISVTDRDRASDVVAIRHSAAEALKEFGLTANSQPEDAARALEPYHQQVDSPQQMNQLATECYYILLVWAETEATPLPDKPAGSNQDGLRRALDLLRLAEALGKAHDLKTPRALHAQRAHYLALRKEAAAAGAEKQRADRAEASTSLDLFLSALDEYRQGRFAQAVRACDVLLQRDVDHFGAQYLRALCRMRETKWAEARIGLTACLSRRPDFYWARLLRAVATSKGKEGFDLAEADFNEALAQAAADPLARWTVLNNRAVMWAQRKQWDKAIADLKEGIPLQPDAYQGYLNLALAYQGRKDWEAASAALDQALRRRPDAGMYHTRARLHLLREDPAAARRDFEQAIAREPRGSTSERLASDYVELGHLQHRARDYQAALTSFDAALRVVPDYPPAHRLRAETLLRLDRYVDAGQALDLFLAKGKPTWDVYQARGLLHVKQGNYPEAVRALSRALELKQDATTLRQRAWIYLKLGAAALALPDFEAALRLNAADAEALCGRGQARARLGQSAAVDDAEAALQHGPRTSRLLLNAARVYSQVAGHLEAMLVETPGAAREMARYQGKAVELVADALERVPTRQRGDFWDENIRKDADLFPVRRSPGMLDLARRYAR